MSPLPPGPDCARGGPALRRWPEAALRNTAEAIARESGGRLVGWELALDPGAAEAAGRVLLYVTVRAAHGCRLVIASLTGNLVPGPAPATEPQRSPVAAVRRVTFERLFWHCAAEDPEPLLEYLRCCGVRVLDG